MSTGSDQRRMFPAYTDTESGYGLCW